MSKKDLGLFTDPSRVTWRLPAFFAGSMFDLPTDFLAGQACLLDWLDPSSDVIKPVKIIESTAVRGRHEAYYIYCDRSMWHYVENKSDCSSLWRDYRCFVVANIIWKIDLNLDDKDTLQRAVDRQLLGDVRLDNMDFELAELALSDKDF